MNTQTPLFELERSRITQSNALARGRQEMEKNEKRIAMLAMSRIKWGQKNFTTVELPLSDIVWFLDSKNKNIYKIVQDAARGLLQRTVLIETDDGGWKAFQWVSSAEYIPASKRPDKQSVIVLQFHDKLKKYLLELKDNFNTFPITEIRELKSLYSIRLFEILWHDSHRGKKNILTYELRDLRTRLAIEDSEYKTYKDFRYVLDTAENELNTKTSLSVSYKGHKTGNVVTRVQFVVTQNENRPPTAAIIEELDASTELDANETALVELLSAMGFRQNPAQTIKTYGYERCLANYKLAKASIAEAQRTGKPIKNPGGFVFDMIKRDVAASHGQTAKKEKPNIPKIAAKLVETFERERADCLEELWHSITPDRQAELHDLMRFSVSEFTRKLLEEADWQGPAYASERNKILMSEYPNSLPSLLQTLEAFVEGRELFSGDDKDLKDPVLEAARNLL